MKYIIYVSAAIALLISHADLLAGNGKGKPFNEADFKAELSGDQEVPSPVNIGTHGEGKFIVNADGTMDFELELEDAENALAVVGAHIHCAPAGVNGGIVVWLAGAPTPGFDGHLELKGTLSDASIVNDACGDTITALVDSMMNGQTYVNVHSADFPGGAVRGQIFLQ